MDIFRRPNISESSLIRISWRLAIAILPSVVLAIGPGTAAEDYRATGPTAFNEVLLGDLLFHTPRVLGSSAQKLNLSCNSCHPSGSTNRSFFIEGLSNRPGNVDLKTGFFHGGSAGKSRAALNIPSLRGVRFTAPYGRDGRISSLKSFIENVVTSEFDGAPLSLARARALIAYVESLDFVPNRYLDAQGRLTDRATADARRGEGLFRKMFAGLNGHSCADCHNPSTFFTDGEVHPRPNGLAGPSAPTLSMFKTQTLLNIADTAPYFHDGRFDRIEDGIAWYNEYYQLALSKAEASDLAEYVKAIGSVDAPIDSESSAERLARHISYLSLLENGSSDREIWEWTLDLVSNGIRSSTADEPIRSRSTQQIEELFLKLERGDSVEVLRPEARRLRQQLRALAAEIPHPQRAVRPGSGR
jgi:cytochrome c peroxidase